MARIDMPREFNNLADDLVRAVDRGRILHKTNNIRDSGAPFEYLFRKIIGSRLPEPYRMRTGFLFDSQSNVTPQIDAVIVDTTTSHEIFTSEEGAGYIPYASASVVFEIKNSLQNPKKTIKQIDAILSSLSKMQNAAKKCDPEQRPLIDPLSLLVIGDSNSIEIRKLQNTLESQSLKCPNFIYLVDVGLVLAREVNFFVTKTRGFLERGNGEWYIYGQPEGVEYSKGRTLLWIYFAVLAAVKEVTPQAQGIYAEFVQSIEHQYPLTKLEMLSDTSAWPKR
jgi:hypothetical protein